MYDDSLLFLGHCFLQKKTDTRMDEKTVLIKISILDEWKYWYSTFHIFCCLPRPQQNRWRFVKIWNLDFVSRRWKETKHLFMTDKRIFIVLIPFFCKIPRERYLFKEEAIFLDGMSFGDILQKLERFVGRQTVKYEADGNINSRNHEMY